MPRAAAASRRNSALRKLTPDMLVGARSDFNAVAGKTVVIAGGTTGIGRATAALLSARGARVLVFGREQRALSETLDSTRALGVIHGVRADQSRQKDIDRVFREADKLFGRLDILINCAAISPETLDDGSFEDFRYGLDVNLLGYIACTQQALRRMRRQKERGHIVHIGSMSADLREEGNPVYVASKAGIQAFAESLRKSANKEGISVTLVEPGAVATPLQKKSRAEKERRIRTMRMLEPEDIAECVHYCLIQPKRCNIVSVQIRPLKQLI